eukprot:CAMPEP_0197183816 /NCGR_PEP_ID=MMETSP1423-20130617/8446_1 /TAXON_ID=476441 /ORGANISM="Pseudo-nitzschia heimii, Strain UNC1101" /LENGTH=88 /DNA_ID=CAMNT_0042634451 /DNA_START=176 /DNA_END=442 /DNA_ORIENTATION=+
MCRYCNPNQVDEPIDIMGNNRSYQFFSVAAIEEAVRATSGGCTPVCSHHRSMLLAGNLRPLSQEEEDANEEDETEQDLGDDDDEYDGT